ncbi:MAG: ribonuclease HI family protein [Variovorax sp.]
MQPWLVHCDGSAMPNPGRMGLGAVIVAPDGTRHTLSQAMHDRGCNNEAELRALMAALREARGLGADQLLIRSDNSLLVEQLGTAPAKPVERLAPLFDEARALLRSFDAAALEWIPRHRNGAADALARAALGVAPKRVVDKSSRNRRRR